jgi:hypothetical protein
LLQEAARQGTVEQLGDLTPVELAGFAEEMVSPCFVTKTIAHALCAAQAKAGNLGKPAYLLCFDHR